MLHLIFQKIWIISKGNKDKLKYFKINLPLNTNTLQYIRFFYKLQNKEFVFKKRKTDLVFIKYRFETFAFAILYLRKIPIIHYEGGDLTEGYIR